MKKLLQYKLEDYYIDISNAAYEYIKYDVNEAIINDDIIDKENNNQNRVVLDIKFTPTITSSQRSYLSKFNKNIFNNLTSSRTSNEQFFLKINKHTKNFFRYYHDKKNADLTLMIDKFGIQNSDSLIENASEGFLINVNKDNEETFKSYCKSTISYNDKDFAKSKELNMTSENPKGVEWFIEDPNFDLNANPIYVNDVYDDVYYQTACIGFLVEKFDENNNMLASRFYLIDNIFRPNVNNFNKTIYDAFVKYGKKYTYVVYPVFLTTVPARNNYHVAETFLYCDSPYITHVECKENINPDTPTAINFKVDKDKKIYINWSRPHTEQNDIAGYFVFKRYSLKEPYELVKIINFLNENDYFKLQSLRSFDSKIIENYKYHVTSFIDDNFNSHKVSIYTLCSYDAHGNFSDYSEQISVLFNPVTNTLDINPVSSSGAPLNFPNLKIPRNIKMFGYQESIEDIVPVVKNKTKFTLYSTPDFASYTTHDNVNVSVLKENYVFSIFKLENQKSFKDIIKIKNFKLD